MSGLAQMPRQETAETRAYKSFMNVVHRIGRGAGGEEELKEWAARNAEVLELRSLGPNEVHVDEVMTNMSIMYANEDLIGDRVLPVVMTGGSLSAKYFKYAKRDRHAYPDDRMGADATRTKPNEISQGRSQATIGLEIRALQETIDQYTLQNQSAPLNELYDAVQNVLYALKFRRELRVVESCTTPSNFGANTLGIASGDRWDTATGGDPGSVMDFALKSLFAGNGPSRLIAVASLDVYNALKRNPRVLDMFKYGGAAGGDLGAKFATPRMLAEYFEVDEFLVGRARKETANEGQPESYSRIWPDVLGIYRVAQTPATRNVSFGYTFQDLATQSDLMWKLDEGAKGAYVARSGHADAQQIICADAGFLITTPIN